MSASVALSPLSPVSPQGTNVEQAKALVESSGFRMIMADDLDDAAMKAVKVCVGAVCVCVGAVCMYVLYVYVLCGVGAVCMYVLCVYVW